MEEKEKNDKIFSCILETFKEGNNFSVVNILRNCEYSFDYYDYDNWNGGIEFYELLICLHTTYFNKFSNDDFAKYEKEILSIGKKFFDDNGIILGKVVFKPIIEEFIDWDCLNGIYTKDNLVSDLEKEKSLLIKAGTGVNIKNIEDEYVKNHRVVLKIYGLLRLNCELNFYSLWDWYNYYKDNPNLDTYNKRRIFINNKYGEKINYFEKSYINNNVSITAYKSGWENIDNSIEELSNEICNVKDRIKLNEIGVRCRETTILLAKTVYKKDIHCNFIPIDDLPKDGKAISDCDSYRELLGFIYYKLQDQNNIEIKAYLKKLIYLLNDLTHAKEFSNVKAIICIESTIHLVKIVKLLSESNPN